MGCASITRSTARRRVSMSLAGACLIFLPGCATPVVRSGDVLVGEGHVSANSRDEGRPENDAPEKVPVMLPDERVPCPFQALGTVTIKGPFVLEAEHGDASSSEVLIGIRDKLGREAASLEADGALVRRILYDRRQSSSRSPVLIQAVEALLFDYTDPDCTQTNP